MVIPQLSKLLLGVRFSLPANRIMKENRRVLRKHKLLYVFENPDFGGVVSLCRRQARTTGEKDSPYPLMVNLKKHPPKFGGCFGLVDSYFFTFILWITPIDFLFLFYYNKHIRNKSNLYAH